SIIYLYLSVIYFFFFHSYLALLYLHSFPTRRSSDLFHLGRLAPYLGSQVGPELSPGEIASKLGRFGSSTVQSGHTHLENTLTSRSEEHTSELQSPCNLVCRLLLEKKNKNQTM